MIGRNQTITLIILLFGLLSLTLLGVHLQTSDSFPSSSGQIEIPRLALGESGEAILFPVLVQPETLTLILRIILFALTIFGIAVAWRTPKLRRLLVYYAVVIVILYFTLGPVAEALLVAEEEAPVAEVDEGERAVTPPMELDTNNELPPVAPTDQPAWLELAVALVPALLIVAAVALIARRYLAEEAGAPLATELGRDAEEAIIDIEQGHDLRSAIMRAYLHMNETVQRNRGIVRKRDVTAGEFMAVLQQAGLPRSPVERLTRLFEQVRYSSDTPGVRDQMEAVSCLSEIVDAVERIKEKA